MYGLSAISRGNGLLTGHYYHGIALAAALSTFRRAPKSNVSQLRIVYVADFPTRDKRAPAVRACVRYHLNLIRVPD